LRAAQRIGEADVVIWAASLVHEDVLQHVRAGSLRALAHWGDGPLAALPGVPPLKDAGFAQVRYIQWSGLFVRRDVPETTAQRLRSAARAAAADGQALDAIASAGSPMQYLDTEAFAAYVQQDARRMAGVVRRIGTAD